MKYLVLYAVALLSFSTKGFSQNTTRACNVGPYTRIVISGSYKILLEQSNAKCITISGKSSVIGRINLAVKDGLLILRMSKERDKRMRVRTDDLPTITIPVNSRVSDITFDGYTDIKTSNQLSFNHLTISTNGASKIALSITCSLLVVEASGASYIDLHGKCNNLTLIMNGAGMFDGFSFATINSNVVINGSGKARMNVKDRLSGNISGFGTIYYKGTPKLNVTKSFGIVKQID